MSTPDVSAVVLAYGSEPWLVKCVDALLGSEDVAVEVVVVDNGCTDGAVDALEARSDERIVVVRPGENLGYASGCNEGVRHATGRFVAFVNYDAVVDRGALRRLVDVAGQDGVGIATASIRLADDEETLNSAGNDIHFLGFSWSGSFGEPASSRDSPRPVTGASGAAMVLRREVWDDLAGFADEYFMYHEDAELSLRCHLSGRRIEYVPDAVVVHRYEFSRNPRKFYLVERNRLLMVLTCFERRTLALVAPALLAVEVATALLAAREGWLGSKVRAWRWLATNGRWVRDRRRAVQSRRVVPDRALAPLLVGRIEPANYRIAPPLLALNVVLDVYWRAVRRALQA